jgi:hypothetical protein
MEEHHGGSERIQFIKLCVSEQELVTQFFKIYRGKKNHESDKNNITTQAEGPRKATNNSNQDSWTTGGESNRVPPHRHKSRARCSVCSASADGPWD